MKKQKALMLAHETLMISGDGDTVRISFASGPSWAWHNITVKEATQLHEWLMSWTGSHYSKKLMDTVRAAKSLDGKRVK